MALPLLTHSFSMRKIEEKDFEIIRDYMLIQNEKLSLIYISQKRKGHRRDKNLKEKRNSEKKDLI